MAKALMLCNCGNSQTLDTDAIGEATGLKCSVIHNGLCTSGLDTLAQALPDGDLIIACAQEASVFEDLAAELDANIPQCVDIRDRAGWSDEDKSAAPKIAALLVEASLPVPVVKTFDVVSEGLCLIIGASDVALTAAEQLSEAIDVTAVLTDTPEIIPGGLDVLSGHIRSACGTLGRFEVTVDNFRTLDPSGRGARKFTAPRDGGKSECDIILDLTGKTPLFSAPEKRDGYLRADPKDPLAVARAVYDAAQMRGTFEKPFYVAFEEHLCAHSRATKTGCNRCLDVCPTGAITSNGDSVSIDPNICAGCGECAAVCPSGAVTYDAPPVQFLFNRIRTLASTYLNAGGKAPRLLVHDTDYGSELISLAARFSRGLPADVIPLAVPNIAGFGHSEMLVALACGFTSVDILASPKTEREALDPQLELALAMAPGEGVRIRIIDPVEPDTLCAALYIPALPAMDIQPILPLGGRREATRLAASALATGRPVIALPADAPYGAVLVNNDACTLCLSCASLCPSGALGDNPDMPQLRFKEDACLQCGICVSTCPENAISLIPQMDLSAAALTDQVVHEEEPYECIECGKPFGVKSTVERIVEKLEGKHSMFTNSDNAKLIRMCDDCRIRSQFHSDDAPMFAGKRAPTRTTQDYLDERAKKDEKPN